MTTVWAVYFSGTGTTERTVTHIAGELARLLAAPCRSLDFTRPQVRQQELNFCQSDLVVLGTPVYAGRVPNVLLPFLREKVRGGPKTIRALTVPSGMHSSRSPTQPRRLPSQMLMTSLRRSCENRHIIVPTSDPAYAPPGASYASYQNLLKRLKSFL